MAIKQPAGDTAEMSEREFQATVNSAVAATEDEIFNDALGSEELENDGDTSLEEMGEGLEGEVDPDENDAEDEGEEGAEDGDEESEAEEEAEEPPPRGQEQRRGEFVPRARRDEEANRRRAVEQERDQLRQNQMVLEARINDLAARLNQPQQRQPAQQQEPPAPPDMFAEPERYREWMLGEVDRRAREYASRSFAEYQQQQQHFVAQRVDENLASAARGTRAFEFNAAYNAITQLDPRDPQAQKVVRAIYNSPDPATAIFEWWENNGGPEYREHVYEQLQERVRPQPSRGRQPQPQQQPRHVIRRGQTLPSLNAATGSNSQRQPDPEMYDGSEASVFSFSTRR